MLGTTLARTRFSSHHLSLFVLYVKIHTYGWIKRISLVDECDNLTQSLNTVHDCRAAANAQLHAVLKHNFVRAVDVTKLKRKFPKKTIDCYLDVFIDSHVSGAYFGNDYARVIFWESNGKIHGGHFVEALTRYSDFRFTADGRQRLGNRRQWH